MDGPKSAPGLSAFINNYLSTPTDGNILKGHVLANFRSKNTSEFIEYLSTLYGNDWNDGMKKGVLTSVRRIEGNITKNVKSIYKQSVSDGIVRTLTPLCQGGHFQTWPYLPLIW